MSTASPVAWLRRSIAHGPQPRTWPPVAPPAIIICECCSAPSGVAVLTTDSVRYLRCTACGKIWSVTKPRVAPFSGTTIGA